MEISESTLVPAESFTQYVEKAQALAVQEDLGKVSLGDILAEIELAKQQFANDEDYQSFFNGEMAFFQEQYQNALDFYKNARSVPNFQFYCCRATAYILAQNERDAAALTFARKALKISPDDLIVHRLFVKLHTRMGSDTEAGEWHVKVSKLLDKYSMGPQADALEQTTDFPATTEESGESFLQDSFHDIVESPSADLDVEETLVDSPPEAEEVVSSWSESYQSAASPYFSPSMVSDTKSDDLFSSLQSPERLKSIAEYSQTAPLGELGFLETGLLDLEGLESTALESYSPMDSLDGGIGNKSSSQYLSEHFGLNLSSNQTLESRIQTYKKRHSQMISDYVERSHKRATFEDNFLYFLTGWDYQRTRDKGVGFAFDQATKSTQGLYFRWEGKGVVINPGTQFLETFHAHNFFIKDIDYVIVTNRSEESYTDLQSIYDLNYQHNTISKDLHVINYYLNQQAYHGLSTTLKPHFKQERNTVHSLELYLDSAGIEEVSLDEHISMCYFLAPTASNPAASQTNNIGIRLELRSALVSGSLLNANTVSLAYISGMSWSPIFAEQLYHSDVVIAAFEETRAEDYNKEKYNEQSLGYYGTLSLIEQCAPALTFTTEFGAKEGDIRLEVVKKLRHDCALGQANNTVVLPADTGLFLDLKSQRVRCSVSQTFVLPSEIKVIKPIDAFGNLQYLSPACFV